MAVDNIRLAKAILWEQTKGNLRALGAASGASPSTESRSPNWEEVGRAVEKFIKNFEDHGLQE